ncbi:phage tail protein [Pediococcus pentosaceus]|uniref:phage tail protein n=1 Tax=Pediococcus pentosaceus TaxID=1255 RepID=UPI001108119A|nr:phage tail protein [Pediococcus pentosaceus]KAF0422165.1 hypothetical protein GBO84_02220 [Pediococcus pentosaceus]TLQ00362.1 hypothetical protein FEZ50_07395 [Pediococcus pentosaceus]
MTKPVLIQAKNSSSIDRLTSFVPDSFAITWEMNGDFKLSLTTWNDGSPAYANLSVENTIKYDGSEYFIKQATPDYSQGIETLSISATHVYSEVGQIYQRKVKKGDANYTPTDILEYFFKDNKLGFSYNVIGNFSKQKITDLGNCSAKDALSKILELWSDCVIYPVGRVIKVYTRDNFFKNYGHRIDYLNSASEINFEYDSTDIVNQVRAVGPTFEKTVTTGDSSKLSGATTAVNGDWGPAIRYAAKLMGVKISDANVNKIKDLIQHESGGSETVVNNSDSNAAAGHPSKGLVQFIQSTFNAYMVKPYTNILKGFHQLLAFFNNSNWEIDMKLGGWGPTGSRRRDSIIHKKTTVAGTGAKKVIADAKKYLGVPYVWGGHNKSNPRAGMDCSGFVSQVYYDFGINIPAYTVSMERYGHTVSTPQTGDMLFYGAHGSSHHVALALDSKTMIYEPQPGESCRMEPISYYPPSWIARNNDMAKIVADNNDSGNNDDNSGEDATTSTTTTENYFEPFIVQDDESIKKWGLHPGGDVSSDTIKNKDEMKKWVLTQLKPDPTLSIKATADNNDPVTPGDMIRLEIRPKQFVSNMGVVGYEYHPFSKTSRTSITLNQTAKTILDYEKSRNKNIQTAKNSSISQATDNSSGQETWTDEEVNQFGSGL